jgi:hypothetical protein
MAGSPVGTRLVFNRRYATEHNITGSDPWVKTHGYHHNVATRRTWVKWMTITVNDWWLAVLRNNSATSMRL